MWMSASAHRCLSLHQRTVGDGRRSGKVQHCIISQLPELRFSWLSSFRGFRGGLGEDEPECRDGVDTEKKIGSIFEDLWLLVGMLKSGTKPTGYVLNKTLSCCAKTLSLGLGEQVHGMAVKMGSELNVYVCSPLIDLYGKCGMVWDAHKLFDEMPVRNVVTWNSLMCGYLKAGAPEVAVGVFSGMMRSGVGVSEFSVSAVLVACAQLEDGVLGNQIQCLCLKSGMCGNVVVGTGLINVYAKSRDVDLSTKIFDEMVDRNVITWTAVVLAFVQNEQPEEALRWVREMRSLGLRPNEVTYNNLLSSFSEPDCMTFCRQVHCCVIREGFESYLYVAVTLVVAYSECGCSLGDYHKICSCNPFWNQIAWNAVIAGFARLECRQEAFECFGKMRQAGVCVDFFTILSALKAAGVTSALEEGKQVHALVLKTGDGYDINVQNSLVSMYAKCGHISDSKSMFSSMKERDVITWNSLICGYANQGHGTEAVELFKGMRKAGEQPDRSTYLLVLSACSHAGLLEEGLECFSLMKNDDLIDPPASEHYAVVVDLFGRAGHLREAEVFIDSMPIKPGLSVYKALLSACLVHGNFDIATRWTRRLLELYPDDPGAYVLLSNVLATGGNWDDAAGLRKLMAEKSVQKKPAYSWV
uniref:Pentatricopeptide repeat-containing protein n=1 Tax=Kalanchoe fedtschenkoi TaxID=63787 RepID=A0A7N0U4R8_KALFE